MPGASFIQVADVHRALALAAARFYHLQPETIVAVTGTSGKTSVAVFTRQIWQALGYRAASLGTIGLVAPSRMAGGALTTPDPVNLHETLDALASDGVTHLALEASSHGLDQRRLDGLRLKAARLHQSFARSSRLSSAISILILPRRCASSKFCCRKALRR